MTVDGQQGTAGEQHGMPRGSPGLGGGVGEDLPKQDFNVVFSSNGGSTHPLQLQQQGVAHQLYHPHPLKVPLEHQTDRCSLSDDSDHSDSDPQEDDSHQYCIRVSILSFLGLVALTILIYICRDYLKILLLWMENINLWAAAVIFAILFTIVSFPMVWGYVILNVAAGYLYGFCLGFLLVFCSALVGIIIAHTLTKRFLGDYVMSKLVANDSLRAILRVVESERGFKVVALARLTPIPFGLQNGLFSIAKITYTRYILSTTVGLLPTQVLNTYIGTTLRSMEEVLTDSSHTITAYVVFIVQLLLTVILTVYVVRRARRELAKMMEEHEQQASAHKDRNGNRSPSAGNVVCDPFCHRRIPSNGGYKPVPTNMTLQNGYSYTSVHIANEVKTTKPS